MNTALNIEDQRNVLRTNFEYLVHRQFLLASESSFYSNFFFLASILPLCLAVGGNISWISERKFALIYSGVLTIFISVILFDLKKKSKALDKFAQSFSHYTEIWDVYASLMESIREDLDYRKNISQSIFKFSLICISGYIVLIAYRTFLS
jgi:hypothetical protein